MGPALRVDPTARLLLDPVVADRGGRSEGLVDVALLEEAPLAGGMRPDPGQAVGLQLEPDRERVGPRRAALLLGAHLVGQAQEMLDVVADLVGQHVRLREVPGRAESAPQLVIEREVDVDLAVLRAVEGAGRGLGDPAAGARASGEEHQVGALVVAPHLLKLPRPGVLHVVEHERDEVRALLLRRRCLARRGRRRASVRRGGDVAAPVQQGEEVLPEDQAQHQQDHRAAQADAAADPEPAATGRSLAAAVLDVVAPVPSRPPHGGLPSPGPARPRPRPARRARCGWRRGPRASRPLPGPRCSRCGSCRPR